MKLLSPMEQYQLDLKRADFHDDPHQKNIVEQLDTLYHTINKNINRPKRLWPFGKSNNKIKGLYLYGPVGRGKTYLMDLLSKNIDSNFILRKHFHVFMTDVHLALRKFAGHKNPLPLVAKHLAGDASILCFDEFFVDDVADALILAKLMECLFKQGFTLIATSNVKPDDLYKNGVQRQLFLPAIELIREHCHIIQLDNQVDYRKRALEQAGLYFTPIDDNTSKLFFDLYETLSHNPPKPHTVNINGRNFSLISIHHDIAWFSFDELCNKPVGAEDYLELACRFHTIFIEKVPSMTDEQNDSARRFVNFVDICYDLCVKIIVQAETEINLIYVGKGIAFEFQRTQSRLTEMHTQYYLDQPHKSIKNKNV